MEQACTCIPRTFPPELATECPRCGGAFRAWVPAPAADAAMSAGALPTGHVLERAFRAGLGEAVHVKASRDLAAWFLGHDWTIAAGLVRDVILGRRPS